MAKRIGTHRFAAPQRSTRYPWHEWADGSAWKLVEGEDYDNRLGLIRSARQHAWRKGLRCRIDKSHDSYLVIQFLPR